MLKLWNLHWNEPWLQLYTKYSSAKHPGCENFLKSHDSSKLRKASCHSLAGVSDKLFASQMSVGVHVAPCIWVMKCHVRILTNAGSSKICVNIYH